MGRGQTRTIAIALGVIAAGIIRGGAFYRPDLIAVPVVLVAAAAASRVRVTKADRRLVAALGLFALVWLVRGASVHSLDRADALAAAAVAFGASYVLARNCDDRERLLVVRGLVGVSALTAAVSLLRWSMHSPPWGLPFDGVWRLAGPFAYPNAAGLFFALAFLANAASDERNWIERACCGTVLIGALVATASRGAFLALGVGLLVSRWRALRLPTRSARAVTVVAAGVAAAAALYVSLLTFGVIGNAGAHDATASMNDRVAEWSAAARQGADNLLLGAGPDRDLQIHNFRGDAVARYAHNEPLQIFAGAGLVGVASFGMVVAAAINALRSKDGPRGRLPQATAAVLLMGGLVDFNWHFVALVAFAGWLIGGDEYAGSPTDKPRTTLMAAATRSTDPAPAA